MRVHGSTKNVFHIGFDGTLTITQGPSVDPYAAYLVYDNFTAADGTLLEAHAPDKDTVGTGWVDQGNGVWQILSNAAIPKTMDGYRAWTIIDSGDAAPEVQTAINLGETYDAGLVFRMTDLSNFMEVCCISSASNIQVWKCAAGGWSNIANGGALYSGTIVLNVKIDANSKYTVSVDGVEAFNFTDTFNNTETKHGMRPYNNILSSHDYYWVKA